MKTVSKLTAIAFGLSMTSAIVSGGVYLIQKSRSTDAAIKMAGQAKQIAMISGGVALLSLGVNYFININIVKQVKAVV